MSNEARSVEELLGRGREFVNSLMLVFFNKIGEGCSGIDNPSMDLLDKTISGNADGVAFILKQCDGININIEDESLRTPLIYASSLGHLEIVKLLLEEEGINLNTVNQNGLTPLMFASDMGHVEIVRLLLGQEGIDINVKGGSLFWKSQRTALHYALDKGHLEVVELELDLG